MDFFIFFSDLLLENVDLRPPSVTLQPLLVTVPPLSVTLSRHWLPFKCRSIVCLSIKLAAGQPDLFFLFDQENRPAVLELTLPFGNITWVHALAPPIK